MNDKPEKMPPVPPFVRFVASAVPMVFDNSLSYYEALCALWKYIQSMTDVINNNATLEEEYIEKFNELKSFVDNYFENLDVQEEINNKLDQMAEDGTLQEIVASYLESNVTWTFDTVADMKASTNLIIGSHASTLGYHAINDGGAATYYVASSLGLVADEGSVIALGDGKVAILALSDNHVNVKQFGAKGDGTTNDSTAIRNALKFKTNDQTTIEFIKGETYIVDGNFYIYSNTTVDLNGCEIKVIDGTPASDAYNRVQFLNNLDSMTVAGYGSLENFHVKNGTFNGNIGGVTFALFHALNCSFEDIEFKDCFVSTHVFDLAGCKDIEIKHCNFIGNLLSVSANNFREVIQPDYASYTSAPYWGNDDSYEYDGIETVNLTVDGCLFKKNQNDTYYLNGVGTHATGAHPHDNIVVKNCIFYDCQLSSIRLPQANNITIDGNIFYNIARGRNTDNYAIDISNLSNTESLHDVIIRGNKFISTGSTTDQIFVNVSGRASNTLKNVSIYDNEYSGTAVSESDYAGSDYIHANHIEGFILKDNHVTKAKSLLYKPAGVINNIVTTNNICDNCLRGLRGGGSITDNTDGNFPTFINSSNNIWKTPVGCVNTSGMRIVLGLESDLNLSASGFTRLPLVVKEGLSIYIDGNGYARIPSYIKRFKVTGELRVQTTGSGVLQWSSVEFYDRAKQQSHTHSYDHRVSAVNTSKSVSIGQSIMDTDDFVWYNSSTSGLEWLEGRVSMNIGVSITDNLKIFAENTVIILESF